MPDKQIRPFLFGQQRDVLSDLTRRREQAGQTVMNAIGEALDPESAKIDGKAGAFDGVGTARFAPLKKPRPKPAGGRLIDEPGFGIDEPGTGLETTEGGTGLETTEGGTGKEATDGGTGKEATDGGTGKESTDGGTGKESTDGTGKESTDGTGKEATEGGTGKEATDGGTGKEVTDGGTGKEATDSKGKFGGDETLGPFRRLGDPAELPWDAFDVIAQAHADRVKAAMRRGIVF